MHQPTAPTHKVGDAVAQPSDEELCTFAHAPHYIDPEGEKGDVLVRARLGVAGMFPIHCFNEKIFNARAHGRGGIGIHAEDIKLILGHQ